jgi:hypothetical protein
MLEERLPERSTVRNPVSIKFWGKGLPERGKAPSMFIMMEEKVIARGKVSRGLYCWRTDYQREERNPGGS